MIKIGAERFRSRHAASEKAGNGSGGDMEEFSRRLNTLEVAVAATQAQLPYLATTAPLNAMETRLVTMIAALDTRLTGAIGAVETRLAGLEGRLIKWMIATLVSSVAAAVAVSRFLHDFP